MTVGRAVQRLSDAGLLKRTFTGKYRPTKLGFQWLDARDRAALVPEIVGVWGEEETGPQGRRSQ